MQNPAVTALGVLDLNTVEPSAISRLASSLWETDRILENGERPVAVFTSLDNLGVELTLARVAFEGGDHRMLDVGCWLLVTGYRFPKLETGNR